MGKSALRFVVKTAAAHAVYPVAGKDGVHQPPYVRGGLAVQTSRRLKFHQSCVAMSLAGKTYVGRMPVREALTAAAKACAAKNPHGRTA